MATVGLIVQASSAVVGLIVGSMVVLVRLAIGAERRRADDWRTAAQTTAAANAVMVANQEKMLDTMERFAGAQDSMLALLQKMAAGDRSAA